MFSHTMRRTLAVAALAGMAYIPAAGIAAARVLSVGPGQEFDRPSAAAAAAQNGDTIEIAAGIYEGDVAVWRANDLTIKGVGGAVELRAAGKSADGKGLWVIAGDDTVVDGITFSGVRVPDLNGAGIRLEGCDLTVRHSVFYDNEMGILTNHRSECGLTLEFSEFRKNAMDEVVSGRQGHNIYVGRLGRFIMRGCYVHGAVRGHQVKSRAEESIITYNRITDEATSSSSYLIDIPQGGRTIIIGNILQQNGDTQNPTLISLGAEQPREASSNIVMHNTLINAYSGGTFVFNGTDGQVLLANNLISGEGKVLEGPGDSLGNVQVGEVLTLEDNADSGLRPAGESPAIDEGLPSEFMQPEFEYQHPLGLLLRQTADKPDAGAYESTAQQ